MAAPDTEDVTPEKESLGSNVRAEWQARQARQRLLNNLKAILGILLIGIVVGLAVINKDQLMALLNKKKDDTKNIAAAPKLVTPPPAVKQDPPPVAPPATAVKPPPPVENAVPAKVPAEVIPVGEEAAARALIESGRAALEQFSFKQAGTLFSQAAQKKAGPLIAEAKSWASKAVQFESAISHIPVSDYAAAETSYILRTQDGSEMHGLIEPESLANPAEIVIQRVFPDNPMVTGKQKLTVGRSDVREVVPVSRDKRQEDFNRLLGVLTSNFSPERSVDYYDVAYVCRRLNLGARCIEYLDMAYSGANGKTPDKFLGDTFRKHVIHNTIERASLMLISGRHKKVVETELNNLVKRVLPGYQAAEDEVEAFRAEKLNAWRDDFKSTITLKEVKRAPAVAAPAKPATPAAPEKKPEPPPTVKEMASDEADQVEIEVDNNDVKGKSANSQKLVEEANKNYDEGMKLYRGFRQGTNGNNNKLLKSALGYLEKAVDLYGKVIDMDGGNKVILDRQTEANMIAYACRKYQTL
jgi:hypothetical protein